MIKKYWHIFWFCRKISLMKMMEYRADFLFWALISTLWTVFNLLFYTLIITVNQSIAGWSLAEMYLILGVFNFMDAFIWSVMYGNMLMYTKDIFSGELTFSLIKPVDPQFFLMTRYNSYNNFVRILLGIGLVFWYIYSQRPQLTVGNTLSFIALVAAGLVFFYSIWFIASTWGFWVEKLDNINQTFPGIRSFFQVPHQVYTGIASTILTVLFPLALVVSVPSEFLIGRGSWWLALNLILACGVTFLLSRWFFFFSLKRYSGVAN